VLAIHYYIIAYTDTVKIFMVSIPHLYPLELWRLLSPANVNRVTGVSWLPFVALINTVSLNCMAV
jgi:hypothetical protein